MINPFWSLDVSLWCNSFQVTTCIGPVDGVYRATQYMVGQKCCVISCMPFLILTSPTYIICHGYHRIITNSTYTHKYITLPPLAGIETVPFHSRNTAQYNKLSSQYNELEPSSSFILYLKVLYYTVVAFQSLVHGEVAGGG